MYTFVKEDTRKKEYSFITIKQTSGYIPWSHSWCNSFLFHILFFAVDQIFCLMTTQNKIFVKKLPRHKMFWISTYFVRWLSSCSEFIIIIVTCSFCNLNIFFVIKYFCPWWRSRRSIERKNYTHPQWNEIISQNILMR